MRISKCLAASASLLFATAAGSAAVAQDGKMPTVEFTATEVMAGVGGSSGEGVLKLPNLGADCEVPFTVKGFGGGLKVGLSNVSAAGPVKNLTKIADFPGEYTTFGGESTIVSGGGGLNMQNKANKVLMDLKSRTEGLGLGLGGQGMTIALKEAVKDGPRRSVVEFGFNKHWVSKQSEQDLAALIDGWKCRYASVEVVGYADTVGDEASNVEISDKRAKSVRDFLVSKGFAAERITTRAAGKAGALARTGEGMRQRSNRIAVVTVK